MISPKWISLVAILCFFGAVVFLLRTRRGNSSDGDSSLASQSTTPPSPSQDSEQQESDPDFTTLSDGRTLFNPSVSLSQELHQDSPQRDLEIIAQILEHYRSLIGDNPAGTDNAEFIPQLLGQNPRKLVFIEPEHSALSNEQELLDRWNSPFIFQTLPTSAMDIFSSGPDQTLWTEDDLVTALGPIQLNLQL